MSDFTIEGSINKDDVPPSRGRASRDYSALLKSVATLKKDEALEISVAKKHVVSGIRNAIDKEFKHTKYKVTQRSNKDTEELTCYILRES